MKKVTLFLVVVLFGFFFTSAYPKAQKLSDKAFPIGTNSKKTTFDKVKIQIDKGVLTAFFKKHPQLKKHKADVVLLYKNRKYKSIWYDSKGLIEFANVLFSKVNQLEEEGLQSNLAYKKEIDGIFNGENQKNISQTDTELLLSSMYVFYAKKVFQGIDTEKTQEIGWFIPRKNIAVEQLLDTLLVNPELLAQNKKQLFKQYYKLRDYLKKYRQIEQNGEWNPITIDSVYKTYKPDDSSKVIGQIRNRLAILGDIDQDSKSNVYDQELMNGVLKFKIRNAFYPNFTIEPKHIYRMNIPIEQYIKTIMANMERCRWIDPKLSKAEEFIIINIPSFKLLYKKNGITELESDVIVGKNMTETVIFSSAMNQIVFSPYWNIPQSIITNEMELPMSQNKNYLEENNMERINGGIRQKPGPDNPMGLVKFMFPNSNDIYLHDTPFQMMFQFEYKAYSHGCINLNKAKELAEILLKDDPNWSAEKIHEAMNGGKETIYNLKRKIPIHIGYFTTWVNDAGIIHFYNDLYERDERLYELLFVGEEE